MPPSFSSVISSIESRSLEVPMNCLDPCIVSDLNLIGLIVPKKIV
jgi:hypothetical protein